MIAGNPLWREPLKFSAASAVTFPSATSPQTAGSIHTASQQGWSLSSNKPLSHRLMPADDKSPHHRHHHLLSTPTERVGPTVCLIKPKGGDGMGHTARQRGRVRWRREGKYNSFSFSSFITLILGCHPSTEHDSQSWLPCPCFSSFSCLSISVLSAASDEKIFATQFLSLFLSPLHSDLSIHSHKNPNSQKQYLKKRGQIIFWLYFNHFVLYYFIIWTFALPGFTSDLWSNLKRPQLIIFHGTESRHGKILPKSSLAYTVKLFI